MSLSEEIGITIGASGVVANGSPEFLPVNRFHSNDRSLVGQVFPYLEGKRVGFYGVPSSVVGLTSIRTITGEWHGELDTAFASSPEVFLLKMQSKTVFLPGLQSEVERLLPGWSFTGQSVGLYNEYAVTLPNDPLDPHEFPYWETSYEKTGPSVLYPYLETAFDCQKITTYKRNVNTGKLFSLRLIKFPRYQLIPFDEKLWRSSVVVDSARKVWSLFRDNLHLADKHAHFVHVCGSNIPWYVPLKEILS